MRTRRSPRNQDRLFRELFSPMPAPAVAPVILADEQIDQLGGTAKRRKQFKREAAMQRARLAIRNATR